MHSTLLDTGTPTKCSRLQFKRIHFLFVGSRSGAENSGSIGLESRFARPRYPPPGDTITFMGTDVAPRRRRLRIELAAGIGVLTLLLAVIIVPPLVNIGRYKARIAEAISASLGRPVRLASVELRLFPRPGFVLTDLTVDEDPAYGAEPLLHANTVMASIRFASLWRGLEISRISVDEASLNLVRMPAG
jgi:AsmA family